MKIISALSDMRASQFGTQASMHQMNMLPPSWTQKCAPDRRCSCYREWKTITGEKRKLMEDGGPNREIITE